MFNTTYKEIYNSISPKESYLVYDIHQDNRTILAELQIEMFKRINIQLYKTCHYNKPRKHNEMIKKLLIEFIKNNTSSKIVSTEPFELNLEALYAIKKYANSHNANKLLNEYIIPYFDDLLPKISDSLKKNNIRDKGNNSIMNYIYVTQRKDGMVCVVGKSHFKYELKGKEYKLIADTEGDVFHEMKENKGTGEILASLYKKDEELQEKYPTCREFLDDYLHTAWIIPVLLVNGATSQLENNLGEYLINNNVPILNLLSHNYK
ncbi:hypothetical protein [Macrococcus armenti]|uniref:hypothetical protein n=1 Tax=Macrococcus armenti TaxID=2875764 RepID=UPI001CCAF908|nr:hypothetical protein [Macrococcus armenti]UBH15794.1 hypothetical protein LAU44_02265 [Macrococcus armenti]UBH18153.1 hypothetical protein LAU39_02270 [Macrococcus armenti]UBH20420.1 hypothetical protein LAU40_02265 [Macrococcus armenti]